MNFIDHTKFWLSLYQYKNLPNFLLSESEEERVEQYCKLTQKFKLNNPTKVNSINIFQKSSYAYDWYRIFSKNDNRLCNFAFGDIQYVPEEPTFTKSRPISQFNANNVLLPLNTIRHFKFEKDNLSFNSKNEKAVWRGAVYKDKRKLFIKTAQNLRNCDVRDTSRNSKKNFLGKSTNFIPRKKQLQNKFIFAIEGNDVASNLKWIMASNSIPIMPKPNFETWFLESNLIPNQHYIEIASDFSNINEVIEKYLTYTALAKEINEESKRYSSQFLDLKKEVQIARIVANRYFKFTS